MDSLPTIMAILVLIILAAGGGLIWYFFFEPTTWKPLLNRLEGLPGNPWKISRVYVDGERSILAYSSTLNVARLVRANADDFEISSANLLDIDIYKNENRTQYGQVGYSDVRLLMTLSGAANPSIKVDFMRELESAQVWAGILRGMRSQAASAPISDQLAQLHELFRTGALTSQEWEQAKVRFLGRPATESEKVAESLRQLHSLQSAGVLSTAEFNMKKWDLLSKP